ncbi:MAG: acyl-CoA desaturase [Cyclobacteriaceae bacterium]
MKLDRVTFANHKDVEFIKTLRLRVADYFKSKNISRYGNAKMVVKSAVMLALFYVPYILMMFGIVSHPGLVYLMWVLMGIGMAGIGMSIMHDANHGAYSKNKYVNKVMGICSDLVGASSTNWKIQHNVLHHTYTNVDGMDEDIDPSGVMRFSPNQKWHKIYRFQHFYVWFFYGIMTIFWVTTKDFRSIYKYRKMGLNDKQGNINKVLAQLSVWKIFYFGYILVLPMIFLSVAWWQVLLGFASLHFVCGLILSCVFQLAHVMPDMEYPQIDENTGSLENNWAIHQLITTANFSPRSKILSWFIGGLNYQIEHHLFPNICHIHYKNISKIVKKTAKEYGLPYKSEPTFVGALWNHARMLKKLGSYELAKA